MRLSPNAQLLVTAGLDGTARIWNVATWTALRVLDSGVAGYAGGIVGAVFSSDGKRLLTSSESTRIWATATGQLLRSLQGR